MHVRSSHPLSEMLCSCAPRNPVPPQNGGANVPANMQAPNGDTCSLFQGIQVAGQMRSQQRGKPQGQQCSVM